MPPSITTVFERTRAQLIPIEVEGGRALYRAGDDAGAVFLVRRGLLAVLRTAMDGVERLVGFVRAGECVGEAGVLGSRTRSATVVALRDTVVDACPAGTFLAALRDDPLALETLMRLIVARAGGQTSEAIDARVVLVAALAADVDAVSTARQLASQVVAQGHPAVVLTQEDELEADRILDQSADTLVFMAARWDEHAWAERCRRQADRILLIAPGNTGPIGACGICATEPLQAHQLVDLVIVNADAGKPTATRPWFDATHAFRVLHLDSSSASVARIARILLGTSIGLALSGGGARAFAHVGAVRALHEAGVEIDLVSGTSMGAIVAAGVASGWGYEELAERIHAAFVATNPLDDIALPILAMTRGRKVAARLKQHFGDGDIADLVLPFTCLSANLSSGDVYVHERGTLTTALRASISLPGVLPPVVIDGQVLVDGGVLRNLPTDILRARHGGTVIGNDVTRSVGLTPLQLAPPASWWRWWGSGEWRKGPPIVSILMRSATIAAAPDIAVAKNAADLYVMPDTAMIEIRDWRAYPRAVEAGYTSMRDALARLDTPVGQLRAARSVR